MKQKKKFSGSRFLGRGLRRLFILLLLAYAGLHTPFAQDKLTGWLETKLSSEDLQVELQGLRGFWPFHLKLASCRLRDAEGLWLEISDTELDWQYKNQSLIINKLQIRDVQLQRLPSLPPKPSQASDGFSPFGFGIDLKSATFDLHLFTDHHVNGNLRISEELFTLSMDIQSPDLGALIIRLDQGLGYFLKAPTPILNWIPGLEKSNIATEIRSQISLDAEIFAMENQVTFPWGNLELPLSLNRKTGRGRLVVETQLRDLLPLSALWGFPLQGAALGKVEVVWQETLEEMSVHLDQLHLAYPPWAFTINSPLIVEKNQQAYHLLPGEGCLNGQRLTYSAILSPDTLEGQLLLPELKLDDLPLPEPFEIKGNLTAALNLSGSWEAPGATLSMTLPAFQFSYDDIGDELVMEMNVDGKWTPETFHLEGRLRDHENNQINLQVTSPEKWCLRPLRLPARDADFDATLKGNINLAMLNRLPWFQDQRIFGTLLAYNHYRRTDGHTEWEGSLNVQEGRYENDQLGTRLNDLDLALRLQEDGIDLLHARASTPGKGSIQGSGKIERNQDGWRSGFAFELKNARILHLDPVQSALSGKVQLRHQSGGMVEASGDLVLEETLFQMDRLPKALPAPLPFTIKGAASPAENKTVDAKAPKTKIKKQWITGEIDLNIPGRLTVEAKNVYSVWEGQFKIAFREKGIYLLGKLTPRRGNVSFFGRNFTLSSGNVNFNDLISVPPVLDLVALYSRQDIEARLNISGIATHPSFALQSSPPLPQDEILSRILFGKDMSTITGLQALEVGMAFTSMMDKNGNTGWDMMVKAKDLLGVDQLELRESGDSAGTAEVVAGRQINNRLYLEFNQRLHEPGSTLLFEYELRRNLSISTETGTHTLPGIGVNWKRDY